MSLIFKQHQQCEQLCFIANPAGSCSETTRRYLSQPRQVFDTGLQHTHGGASVCQTLQLQCRPAQPAALLLSFLVRIYSEQAVGAVCVQNSATIRDRHGARISDPLSQPSSPGFHHLIFPQYKCQAGAARSICMQRHIMVFCVSVDCGW